MAGPRVVECVTSGAKHLQARASLSKEEDDADAKESARLHALAHEKALDRILALINELPLTPTKDSQWSRRPFALPHDRTRPNRPLLSQIADCCARHELDGADAEARAEAWIEYFSPQIAKIRRESDRVLTERLKRIRNPRPRAARQPVPDAARAGKFILKEKPLPTIPPSRVMELLVGGEILARKAKGLLGERGITAVRGAVDSAVREHVQAVLTPPDLAISIYEAFENSPNGLKKEWKWWSRRIAEEFGKKKAPEARDTAGGIDRDEQRVKDMEQALRREKKKPPRPRGLPVFLPWLASEN